LYNTTHLYFLSISKKLLDITTVRLIDGVRPHAAFADVSHAAEYLAAMVIPRMGRLANPPKVKSIVSQVKRVVHVAIVVDEEKGILIGVLTRTTIRDVALF